VDAPLVALIRIAGILHLVLVGVNLVAPRRLGYARGLAQAPPIVRQVFVVHAAYIVLVLAGFGLACLLYPNELAGGRGLGRFVSLFLAAFWLPRPFVQLLYYDRDLRRRHRLADVAFLLLFGYLAAVFAAAALVGGP
jgi:hypothetical protein